MSAMHPHWHATDSEEQAVRIVTIEPEEAKTVDVSPSSVRYASRLPGAVMGIALFVVAGVVLFQGIGTLLGQVADDALVITIKDGGLTPAVLEIEPGQTIEWKNEDTIPHVLSFLPFFPGSAGDIPELPSMFPGSSQRLTVSPSAEEGTYAYFSQTSGSVNGQIEIKAKAGAAASSTAASTPAASPLTTLGTPSATSTPSATTTTVDSTNSGILDDSDATAMAGTPSTEVPAGIPQNPYTVGSVQGQAPAAAMPGNVTQHTPSSHTETGAGIWIVIASSIGAFYLLMRKHFRTPS